jgi:hypothetical protein
VAACPITYSLAPDNPREIPGRNRVDTYIRQKEENKATHTYLQARINLDSRYCFFVCMTIYLLARTHEKENPTRDRVVVVQRPSDIS